MKLLQEGLLPILGKLESLTKGWDGYNGKPIKKSVLTKFKDISYLIGIVGDFRKVGFEDKDIEVIPTPKGTIQLEAQKKGRYFEVKIE